MNTDYVSLKTAKLLKEVNSGLLSDTYYNRMGVLDCFSESDMRCGCDDVRNEEFYAPFLFTAQKWLREEHNLSIEPYTCAGGYRWQICKAFKDCTCGTDIMSHDDKLGTNDYGCFDTYEEAFDNAIQEACKILKDNKK